MKINQDVSCVWRHLYLTPGMLRRTRDQAEALDFLWMKHSRQKIGRPCVGRKGIVVSLPHCEQVARVSTRV